GGAAAAEQGRGPLVPGEPARHGGLAGLRSSSGDGCGLGSRRVGGGQGSSTGGVDPARVARRGRGVSRAAGADASIPERQRPSVARAAGLPDTCRRGPAAVDQPRRKPPTSETPRRRGRPPIPPEQQRRRLLEAARAELRRSDFGSVRVSDVVRTAGMSSRSFYDHFASKEDLLIALIHETGSEILAELEQVFATEPDPVARVDRALDAYLAAFAGTPLDLEKLGESASGRVQKLLRHYVGE